MKQGELSNRKKEEMRISQELQIKQMSSSPKINKQSARIVSMSPKKPVYKSSES